MNNTIFKYLLIAFSLVLVSSQPATETKSYLLHNSGKVYEFVDFTLYEEDIEIITPTKKTYCFEWVNVDTIVYREERIIKM